MKVGVANIVVNGKILRMFDILLTINGLTNIIRLMKFHFKTKVKLNNTKFNINML